MELTLNLNSRLQPMHRHDLEDALQGILEKVNLGEVMGGKTLSKLFNSFFYCFAGCFGFVRPGFSM